MCRVLLWGILILTVWRAATPFQLANQAAQAVKAAQDLQTMKGIEIDLNHSTTSKPPFLVTSCQQPYTLEGKPHKADALQMADEPVIFGGLSTPAAERARVDFAPCVGCSELQTARPDMPEAHVGLPTSSSGCMPFKPAVCSANRGCSV